MENSPNPVREALLLQKELFGDDLFTPKETYGSAFQKAAQPAAIVTAPVAERITVVSTKPVVPEATPAARIPVMPIDISDVKDLDSLYGKTCNCQTCVLGKNRKSYVFGKGNSNATVMLVGEGPGADEDLKGEPFVGRAGQLLTDILRAIKFTREEVYIANIVKCRPPGNRTPAPDEIAACLPYLEKQIELIKPKLILCLGATAAFGLLKKKEALGKLRKTVYQYNETIQLMVTYHPAALLRTPAWKKDCWEDVQAFRALYDKLTGN